MTEENFLKTTVDELDRLIRANTLVGDAIDTGDRIIIPIASFGFGFGGGAGTGDEGKNEGSGAGGGGSVTPVALLVIHKGAPGAEGVQIFSLKKDNVVAEIISTIGSEVLPQVVDLAKQKTGAAQPPETKTEQTGKKE